MDTQATNKHLWKKFKQGDVDAFGKLSSLNYHALYNYGLRFSDDPDFVKDCIQELFLDLWERRANLSETDFVKPYLLKALRHRIIKENLYLKRFREHDQIPFELNKEDSSWELAKVQEESVQLQIEQVKRCIAQLPRRQKEIIYLRYYQNMSYEQIALVMNISKASVATLHYRTLQNMKEQKIIQNLFFWLFTIGYLQITG